MNEFDEWGYEKNKVKTFPKKKPIRLKGKALTALRKAVFERDKGICQDCGKFAPLKDYDGVVDVFTCGHMAHIIPKSQGGDDTLENAKWKCHDCHILKEHCGFKPQKEADSWLQTR